MSELTKSQMQNIWDCELISAWDEKGKIKVGSVLFRFISRVKPAMVEMEDGKFLTPFNELEKYIVSLNLKRCLDRNLSGELCFQAFRSDVIGFIHARCERMSVDLMSGVGKLVVLSRIKDYTWSRQSVRANHRSRVKQRYAVKKAKAGSIEIKARSLSGKHDWKTVS